MNHQKFTPYRDGLVAYAIMLGASLAALRIFTELSWLMSIGAALNSAAFLLFGWDKQLSGGWRLRIPEYLLFGAALAGGSLGAFLGMTFFRHKTLKLSFQVTMALIVMAQILAVVYFFSRGSLFY